ncbi:MAG: GerMN domain-containing protein [Ardenticatenaceae bacterium]|nr:GerMN domain-containing protein [Ardenticatenaceae bacterium]
MGLVGCGGAATPTAPAVAPPTATTDLLPTPLITTAVSTIFPTPITTTAALPEPAATLPLAILPTAVSTATGVAAPTNEIAVPSSSPGATAVSPAVTPDLTVASLAVTVRRAEPGEPVALTGTDFPAQTTVGIGIGPVDAPYEIIANAQTGENGRFTTEVAVPNEAEPGEEWVFVADVDSATVQTEPISITGAEEPVVDGDVVAEGENGRVEQATIYLIALQDAAEGGPLLDCHASTVPVNIDIEPTITPLTDALKRLLSLDQQYYGESGFYNPLYQSDLTLQDVVIEDQTATIYLSGDLQLNSVCDGAWVQGQVENTARQYTAVDSVFILLNGLPLDLQLDGRV